MKKLITLTILSSLIFAGSAFAQDVAPVRDGERLRDGQFRIPKALRGEDSPIADALSDYRSAREEVRSAIAPLRASLKGADEATIASVREQIRGLLRDHAGDQREFRKTVRREMRALREARASDGE